MNWQDLEERVRQIANFRWDTPFVAETLNGVRIDALGKLRPDHWILIEVTKETTLDKLRTDLAKFQSVRPFLFAQNIYSSCYFVTEGDPPQSLVITGAGNHVTVLSRDAFIAEFLDYSRYFHARNAQTFGSAVNPETGGKDEHNYISVTYCDASSGDTYSLDDLARHLELGHRFVLLGRFGTGKSRCIQELFARLQHLPSTHALFPLAINLRDNWGVRRKYEMIRRHIDDLGLTPLSDSAVKVINADRAILLLDGFDEVGSQAWSDDPATLKEIRKRTLDGVRDLLTSTRQGAIISGRDHYFNSEDEMFACLGLNADDTKVITCSDQFNEQDFVRYLNRSAGSTVIPAWIPRRPLVCQILARLEPLRLEHILSADTAEAEFWHTLITEICDREARINIIFSSTVIRGVLTRLARFTRLRPNNVGPLTVAQINQAFEAVTGQRPVDDSATLLHRLALLGRVGVESPDRQFVDTYFLDGLRADDVNQMMYRRDESEKDSNWLNPLEPFGLRVVADEIYRAADITGTVRLMNIACQCHNKVLAGDIAAGLLLADRDGPVDFSGLILAESTISLLDLSIVAVANLSIKHSLIQRLNLSFAKTDNLSIEDCEIGFVEGVAEETGLPKWIVRCDVKSFRQVNTTARIKAAPLTVKQRVFLAIVKKTFFQPGSGRKEEALLRGLGDVLDHGAVQKLMKRLVRDGILTPVKGDQGTVFAPNRQMTKRMKAIMDDLTLSKDPLWLDLG